jgi:fatty acid desaturase
MSSSSSSTTEVCDGDNLAILLALYWVVYLIINAVIFAAAMYALRRCFDKIKLPGHKDKDKVDHNESRTSSRISLVSRGNH